MALNGPEAPKIWYPRSRTTGPALPNYVHQALTGKPITVYGDGKQTRSFCYVSDLIEGFTG